MVSRCPHAGEGCHTTLELQEEGVVCPQDSRGEVCGPAIALFSVESQRPAFEQLDELQPILATFTIQEVPAGPAPLEIREQWVGVVLPVRQLRRAQSGAVAISPFEATLALRAAGKHEASDWWYRILMPRVSNPVGYLTESLAFEAADGEVTELDVPMTSFDFYGRGIEDAELREHLEEYAAASY
jgi:hypothetical protein